MIHFDEVKDKVLEYLGTLWEDGADEDQARFYVIRDVYGRISVYVMGNYDLGSLRENIVGIIGVNWIGQIRDIDESHILYEEISKNVENIASNIYYGERPLVKKNWNYVTREKRKDKAKVISFYSYKGGVGRTTALVLAALQMARKGKRVAVIDMDLEAPGLSAILRQETGMEYPQYGVVDFLVECGKADGQIDLGEYIYSVTSKELLGMNGGELFIMQAAKLTADDYEKYYNKLSRIDFNMPKYSEPENPVSCRWSVSTYNTGRIIFL